MKAFGLFFVVGVLVIVAVGAVLWLVYPDPLGRHAIVVSGLVSLVVQSLSFAILRLTAEKNVIAGWGIGTVIRLLVFVVYALVIVKSFGLPSSPAMISMALFLFLSTLVEPLFLKT